MQLAASQTSSQILCSRVLHRTACLLWRRLGKVWQSSHPSSEQTATICKIVRVTHRRKPIQERVAIKWKSVAQYRATLRAFARRLSTIYVELLPITHPSGNRVRTREQSAIRKSRKREAIRAR